MQAVRALSDVLVRKLLKVANVSAYESHQLYYHHNCTNCAGTPAFTIHAACDVNTCSYCRALTLLARV